VFRTGVIILLIFVGLPAEHSGQAGCGIGFALEPGEILIIVNKDVPASGQIAHDYCENRGVPDKNILSLSLGKRLNDAISRDDYENLLAKPIREELTARGPSGKAGSKPIRCLLTTYGVPFKVGKRGTLPAMEGRLKELEKLVKQEKERIEQPAADSNEQGPSEQKKNNQKLARLQLEIDYINGNETNASVDSELSMVMCGPYELYRWQPNMLKANVPGLSFGTLMVGRLDGPGYGIVKGLIDKAIAAEKTGLKGIAYIDSRGMAKKCGLYGYFDQSLRDLATFTRLRTELPVQEERTGELFTPGSCPQTAIYCGWYSLKKYIDAFEFVDGAVGYHISSFEAVDIRDPNSSQWCPAMLADGITATLGAVAEPYLHSFPEPKAFFLELYEGKCLVEAYYRTKPFNSWQLVLIGDPLYRPFKKPSEEVR
jgi:uncharacterized protein (TIGR03790 family)